MNYEQKEIVLVPFPYSDLSSFKKRPVLILSNNTFNENREDVVVAAITSKQFIDEYSLFINDDSLEYGFLPEESVIKLSKLFTIKKSMIIKKFSKIKDDVFLETTDKINSIINLK